MKKYILKAEPRALLGRKTKNLRTGGTLPATIYGKKIKSTSVQVKSDEFAKLFKEAGETGLVELTVGKDVRPVLIHNVQRDPIHDKLLHVEFFQVDLKEKVKSRVPIEFVGESPVVLQKQGVLLTLLGEVEVEALPAELPEKIDVDVSGLAAVDQEIKVADLKVGGNVTILSEPTVAVVKVGSLITKEAEAEAAAAEAAAAAAKAEAGQTPAETATPEEVTTKEAPAPEAKLPTEEKK